MIVLMLHHSLRVQSPTAPTSSDLVPLHIEKFNICEDGRIVRVQ